MNIDIDHIFNMLSLHHRGRDKVMEESIRNRLNKSLYTYLKELDTGVSYVSTKNELNVIKKL